MSNKIFFITGMSGSGKSTLLTNLVTNTTFLVPVVRFTTRPKRPGEIDDKDYFFISNNEFEDMKNNNKFAETETYCASKDDNIYYKYGTYKKHIDDSYMEEHEAFIMQGSIDVYIHLASYYGSNRIIPILLMVDEKSVLKRAIDRCNTVNEIKSTCNRFVNDIDKYEYSNIYNVLDNITERNVFDSNKSVNEVASEVLEFIYSKL